MKTKVKVCSRCKKRKGLEEFYRDSSQRDGKTAACRECCLASSRTKESKERAAAWRKAHPGNASAWAKAHPEKIREKARAYYKANKEKMIEYVGTVPLAVPVMRHVARIEFPSTKAATICALCFVLSLFIPIPPQA